MVSNIGVMLLIAFIKSRFLFGLYFLTTKPLIGAIPSADIYPPSSSLTENLTYKFLYYLQCFDSL
jgi:hypothetical protein